MACTGRGNIDWIPLGHWPGRLFGVVQVDHGQDIQKTGRSRFGLTLTEVVAGSKATWDALGRSAGSVVVMSLVVMLSMAMRTLISSLGEISGGLVVFKSRRAMCRCSDGTGDGPPFVRSRRIKSRWLTRFSLCRRKSWSGGT